jgi:hypothetical protein
VPFTGDNFFTTNPAKRSGTGDTKEHEGEKGAVQKVKFRLFGQPKVGENPRKDLGF